VSDPLRVVIVDDEPLAREGLRLRLAPLRDVKVVAECGSAREAIDVLARESPDLAFMDIQMPELDGFGVLAHLDRRPLPAVVFVTAHADQALKAFRAGALDYLVKPYDDETLFASVNRIREYVRMVRASSPATSTPHLARLSVKSGERILFIPVERIDWIESAGDIVRVHVGTSAFDYNSTMRDLEESLDAAKFVRIHRTAIVAIRAIAGIEPYSAGEHLVVLADGTKLPLSRRLKARVAAIVTTST
jgi:two-component system LytT family response regulator